MFPTRMLEKEECARLVNLLLCLLLQVCVHSAVHHVAHHLINDASLQGSTPHACTVRHLQETNRGDSHSNYTHVKTIALVHHADDDR